MEQKKINIRFNYQHIDAYESTSNTAICFCTTLDLLLASRIISCAVGNLSLCTRGRLVLTERACFGGKGGGEGVCLVLLNVGCPGLSPFFQ